MRTEGLGFFTGRELHVSEELASDKELAARLVARLTHELVAIGPLDSAIQMPVRDGGTVSLEPRFSNILDVSRVT